MTPDGGSCSYSTNTNLTVSDTDTSGVSISFIGSGKVKATAKITTGGYAPQNNSFATGASTSSGNSSPAKKYITGASIVTSTSNRTFTLTLPNGSGNVSFLFTVDTSGNVVIT
jgi:hypothetical protein